MGELLLDAGDLVNAIASEIKFVGDVRIGAHQHYGRFVERSSIRFPFFEVGGDLGVTAKVMYVLQLALGLLDRLTKQGEHLNCTIELFPALL